MTTSLSYARARLLVGITSVGAAVCMATFLLLLSLFVRSCLFTSPVSITTPFILIIGYVGIFALVQVSGDLTGGIILPHSYSRTSRPVSELVLRLAFSSIKYSAISLMCLTLIYLGAVLLGAPGMILGGLINCVALLIFQFSLGSWLGGFEVKRFNEQKAFVVNCQEPSFVGGVVETLGGTYLIQTEQKTGTEFELQNRYRTLRLNLIKELQPSVARNLFPILFNCVGALTYLGLFQDKEWIPIIAALSFSCFNTLWSFIGLLTLPSLNRLSVSALDGAVLRSGFNRIELEQLITYFDRQGEDEFQRTKMIQSIFHPIPAPLDRINSLSKVAPNIKWVLFHHIARRTLYTSLGFGGMLSRSVHCNAGKPELWVFFPGD